MIKVKLKRHNLIFVSVEVISGLFPTFGTTANTAVFVEDESLKFYSLHCYVTHDHYTYPIQKFFFPVNSIL